MSFLGIVKDHLTQLPFFVGKPISTIPYSMRPGLGAIYSQRSREIKKIESMSVNQKQDFIFRRVRYIATYAMHQVPFYKDLYKSSDVQPSRFKNFFDLSNLPIVTKADLQKVPLEYRSVRTKGRSLVNTGGSSGQPLELYIEPSSIGHEWAHMHVAWQQLGFKPSDLRIVFGGRSNVKNIVQYDSARHQINVDLYCGWQAIADRLMKVFDRYAPTYLHGYPSSIFDFVLWLEINNHPLLLVLREKIKGMFLGSEYPSPPLRTAVEKLLNCRSVSWYGHTERSVLAYENGVSGVYHPFCTYGFAESIGYGRLTCTSYYNTASPLIRYDTGDLISPLFDNGLLTSFKVNDGREGEFILDKNGNKVFLTGLIFGRHHPLFDLVCHIQVHQPAKGYAKVLITPREVLSSEEAESLFDSSNVQIDFSFVILTEVIRTQAGKVPLLVRELG